MEAASETVYGVKTQAGRARLWLLAVVPAVLLLGGCVSPRAQRPQVPIEAQIVKSTERFRKEYVLVPGDQIEVVVRQIPEASRTLLVRADGNITLPLVREVRAAGLTLRELDAELTTRLSERLVRPEVTVIALQLRPPMVYVTGDVNTAAAVPLRDAPTAMQAISLAGGFRRSAAVREVAIIRVTEDGYLRAIPVQVEGGGQPDAYLALRATPLYPDDVIFVPENGRSQFSRLLDDFVNRPLMGVNAAVATYINFRLVRLFEP